MGKIYCKAAVAASAAVLVALAALRPGGGALAAPGAADVSTPAAGSQPATAPSTMPAGYSLRGQVAIAAGLAIQKPDLTRVVVYLGSNPVLDAVPHKLDHATVEQKNKAFVPDFTVIPRNTDVEFPNWDKFDHNVFSRSKAAPAFDLERYSYGQSKSRVFEKTGVVQVFCNIHPSMRAIIFVTPNIYFTGADAAGKFELTDIPAGKYDIVAWQDRCGETRQPVEVGPGLNPQITLTLAEHRDTVIANDPPAHDNSYGVERGLGIKREKLDLPVVTDVHPARDPEK